MILHPDHGSACTGMPDSSRAGTGDEPSRGHVQFVLECHGVRIGIRSDLPGGLAAIQPHLPPGWRRTGDEAGTWYFLRFDREHRIHRLHVRGREIAASESMDELLETLESALHFEVAVGARDRLFVHAGAVGWRGRALILPGRSWSGKTTLVEALLRAGATYFSDEYAVLDPQGNVHPYPRMLSIRVRGARRPRRVAAESLGSRSTREAWPVGLIAVTSYRGGTASQPRPLSAGEALLAMLANTVVARSQPSFALDVLGAAVTGVEAIQWTRGEANDTAAMLVECMDQASLRPFGCIDLPLLT
jgi:hypothetical protein